MQTWDNSKKPNLEPYFGPQKFFREFYLYWYLDIVRNYHHIQFKEKLVNQTWENDEKPNFGANFSPFSWVLFLLDYQMLDIVTSYHRTQF